MERGQGRQIRLVKATFTPPYADDDAQVRRFYNQLGIRYTSALGTDLSLIGCGET
jgi:hypothetical protein